ncbi:MAG: flagellar hook capping FlgD N-terminal domain-containing protein [Opitutaceae bacterium]|jgi:flagellar basal-body rod modification protein FlgD
MSVDAIPTTVATNSDIAANLAGYSVRAPKKVLDSDDFMKLLSTQMSNQDPLKPMDDTAFVSQMASFTSLAQMNQLSKDMTSLRTDQAKVAAASYIGKYVTVYNSATQANVSGEVTSVDTSGDEPALQINGAFYALSTLQRVDAKAPDTTTTP